MFHGNIALIANEDGSLELHIKVSDHVTNVVKVKAKDIEGILASYRKFKI